MKYYDIRFSTDALLWTTDVWDNIVPASNSKLAVEISLGKRGIKHTSISRINWNKARDWIIVCATSMIRSNNKWLVDRCSREVRYKVVL